MLLYFSSVPVFLVRHVRQRLSAL